jgi:hypothetical protein
MFGVAVAPEPPPPENDMLGQPENGPGKKLGSPFGPAVEYSPPSVSRTAVTLPLIVAVATAPLPPPPLKSTDGDRP